MRYAVIAALLLLGQAASGALPTIGADLGAQSRYVWRGAAFNTEPVLWPDVWASWNGVTFTAWSSLDLTNVKDEAFQPTDVGLFLEYARGFGPVTGTVGYGHYIYPGYAGAFPTTGEAYLKAKADLKVLSATLAGNLDLIEVKGLYVSPTLARSQALGPVNATLSLACGFGTDKHNVYYYGVNKTGLTDFTGTLSLAYAPPALASFMSVTANGGYARVLLADFAGTKQNLWCGLTFNFFFRPGS